MKQFPPFYVLLRWISRFASPIADLVFKSASAMLVTVFIFSVAGCGEFESIDDGFGKIRSSSGYGSLDGISGFVHLLEQRGAKVRTSGRISPKINRYDTIIWAPDRDYPPHKSAIDRLEQWATQGDGDRVVIFVGPGFRARQWMEKKQVEIADDADFEKSLRRFSERLIQSRWDNFYGAGDGESCQWFEMRQIPDRRIEQASGPWSQGLATDELELYSGFYEFKIPQRLTSGSVVKQGSGGLAESPDLGYETESRPLVTTLLYGDEYPLLYRITPAADSDGYWDDSLNSSGSVGRWESDAGIYILPNGCFVQNFGLIAEGNQQLAGRLADLCGSQVLVLESGPGPIEVTDSIVPQSNGWAWLGQRPMRDIAPFFLLLATVAFFVIFPIHGRPKRIRLRPEKTFAHHIGATGELLKSSNARQWADEAIKKYHEGTSDKTSG
jgi:hypothetical protein